MIMAKKTEYVTDDDLTKAVSGLLGNESLPLLSPLRDNEVIILCCMKVVMDDEGETEPPEGGPVKLKKLSDLERLFVEGNAHYILTMDYHFWKHASACQQTARLYDELRTIRPEPSEKGLALKKWKPTINVKFADTLEYFGPFDDETLVMRDAMKHGSKRLKDFVDDIAASGATGKSNPEPEPDTEGEPEPEPEPEPAPEPASKSKSAVKK